MNVYKNPKYITKYKNIEQQHLQYMHHIHTNNRDFLPINAV